MIVEVALPADVHPDGRVTLSDEALGQLGGVEDAPQPTPVRLVYAASHVVMDAAYAAVTHTVEDPGGPDEIESHIDWVATMGLRRTLAERGFAIAEAMDTAQRFQIGWRSARRLIEECGRLRLPTGFVAGAGADHLEFVADPAALIDGVVYQASLIRAAGGEVILLPMPELCRWGAGPDVYVDVYQSILAQVEGPVFIHWLGEMFLPELAGYFPEDSFLRVMNLDPDKVRGAKLSLLDADREVRIRAHLAGNQQVLLTGDDFHFAGLIAGSEDAVAAPSGSTRVGRRDVLTGEFSHALLGIFDGISLPASVALRHLAAGRGDDYFRIMTASERLARVIFAAPTTHYKAGLAFLAWLNGQQDNPMLVNHEERSRDLAHFARVAELASEAGVLEDASMASERLGSLVGA